MDNIGAGDIVAILAAAGALITAYLTNKNAARSTELKAVEMAIETQNGLIETLKAELKEQIEKNKELEKEIERLKKEVEDLKRDQRERGKRRW